MEYYINEYVSPKNKNSGVFVYNLRLASAAIDRSLTSSLSDARDALTNAAVDLLSAYKSNVSNLQQSGLVLPASMRLFPVYILALLKQVGAGGEGGGGYWGNCCPTV